MAKSKLNPSNGMKSKNVRGRQGSNSPFMGSGSKGEGKNRLNPSNGMKSKAVRGAQGSNSPIKGSKA
jgi:hypothetical protein